MEITSASKTLMKWPRNIIYLSNKSAHNSSNLARVRLVSMCLGPSDVAVMKGRLYYHPCWTKIDYVLLIMKQTKILYFLYLLSNKHRSCHLILLWVTEDSSILAFSAASVSLCNACLSLRRSMPSSLLKFEASQSTMRWQLPWLVDTKRQVSTRQLFAIISFEMWKELYKLEMI